MEALVESGRHEEARKLYADTVDNYLKERGIYPSAKIMENMEKLGNQIRHSYEILDQIQQNLMEGTGDIMGGYQCSYPVFRGIYQMVERIMERSGQSVYLMLCTIVDSKGNPMEEGPLLEELSERLEASVCDAIRHGDAVTKYGKGQYLILLVNTTRENCRVVQKRINYRFLVGRQRTGIKYYVNSVICSTDR